MFDLLFCLLCWPYLTLKKFIEDSAVGASEFDHESLKFWKLFAIIGLAVLIVVVVAWTRLT